MKTVEHFEKLKQDAEKTFGIEATVHDPVLKEVLNFIVEEEDVLAQIQKMSSGFIDAVSGYSKRDASELLECMRTHIGNRATAEQKKRILAQLEEYQAISEETSNGEDSLSGWLILELQANVLNPIEKQLKRNEEMRAKFWRLREIRRHVANLAKIASVDKKSKAELIVTQKDCDELETELGDLLASMKDNGVTVVDTIWNEYCRIEAEYFSRMNDAYLEPSTPKPMAVKIGEAKPAPRIKIASPVIGDDSEEEVAN